MSFNSAGSAFQRVLVPKAPHTSHLNGSMNEQGEEQSHTGRGLMDQWNSYVQGPPLEQEGYNEGDYGKVVGHDYSNYNFMPAGNAYMYERAGALGPTEAGEGGNGQRGRLQGPLATSNSQHNSHRGAPSPDIMDLVSKIVGGGDGDGDGDGDVFGGYRHEYNTNFTRSAGSNYYHQQQQQQAPSGGSYPSRPYPDHFGTGTGHEGVSLGASLGKQGHATPGLWHGGGGPSVGQREPFGAGLTPVGEQGPAEWPSAPPTSPERGPASMSHANDANTGGQNDMARRLQLQQELIERQNELLQRQHKQMRMQEQMMEMAHQSALERKRMAIDISGGNSGLHISSLDEFSRVVNANHDSLPEGPSGHSGPLQPRNPNLAALGSINGGLRGDGGRVNNLNTSNHSKHSSNSDDSYGQSHYNVPHAAMDPTTMGPPAPAYLGGDSSGPFEQQQYGQMHGLGQQQHHQQHHQQQYQRHGPAGHAFNRLNMRTKGLSPGNSGHGHDSSFNLGGIGHPHSAKHNAVGSPQNGNGLDNSRHSSLDRSMGRGSSHSRGSSSSNTMRSNERRHSQSMNSGSNHDARQQRKELVESPAEKLAYKRFQEAFRAQGKISSERAEECAQDALVSCPEGIRWRIYLDLADQARRMNDLISARSHFLRASEAQPLAAQCWLEWAKLEEESGHLGESLKILRRGLQKCRYNEGLLTKAIRQLERLHRLKDARGMLSVLKYESMDKVWKSILEGAMLEARAGRLKVARELFKLLIQNVPWYGPIYYEAYKLHDRYNLHHEAMLIIKKGLAELPRYGPLWFGCLKILERNDYKNDKFASYKGQSPRLREFKEELTCATRVISRELIWKLHLEHSQAEERAVNESAIGLLNTSRSVSSLGAARDGLLTGARLALVRAVLACPNNLRWKIWLVGARMELSADRIDRARKLVQRALISAPVKSRASVYLECSRLEEHCGNVDCARRILARECEELKGEWKLFHEAALLEARSGNYLGAIGIAERGLALHPGTGRLWGLYVQLATRLQGLAPEATGDIYPSSNATSAAAVPRNQDVLLRALREVPKSGEVWTEGSRCRLNPMHVASFDPGGAQKFLSFAIQFTPQYGDTFIEVLRVEVLAQIFLPRVLALMGLPVEPFLANFLTTDLEADMAHLTTSSAAMYALTLLNSPPPHSARYRKWTSNKSEIGSKLSLPLIDLIGAPAASSDREWRVSIIRAILDHQLSLHISEEDFSRLFLKNLYRRCVNADPNYGVGWFFCRKRATDSPLLILDHAKQIMMHEMISCQEVYVRAALLYILDCITKESGVSPLGSTRCDGHINYAATAANAKRIASAAVETGVEMDFSSFFCDCIGDIVTSRDDSAAHTAMKLARGSTSDDETRVTEFLEDCQTAGIMPLSSEESRGDSSESTIMSTSTARAFTPMLDIGGQVFLSGDFVTGFIGMNRAYLSRNLKDEVRRHVLYNSDHVI